MIFPEPALYHESFHKRGMLLDGLRCHCKANLGRAIDSLNWRVTVSTPPKNAEKSVRSTARDHD
jgi:hypothetical protein